MLLVSLALFSQEQQIIRLNCNDKIQEIQISCIFILTNGKTTFIINNVIQIWRSSSVG